MKKTLLLIWTLITIIACKAQDDVPNDTKLLAPELSLPASFNGTFSPTDDTDCFKFVVDVACVAEFNILIPGALDAQFFVEDLSGLDYESVDNCCGNDINKQILLCPGTYYITFYDDNGESSLSEYTFNLSLNLDDAFECNNTFDDAVILPIDTSINFTMYGTNDVYGEGGEDADVDYFIVEAAQPGVLELEIINNLPIGEFDVKILDMSFNEINSFNGVVAGSDVNINALLCEGQFYIEIQESDGNELAANINLLNLNFIIDEFECNNTYLDTIEIGVDTTIGLLLYGINKTYGEAGYDPDAEYFLLNIETPGVLELDIINNLPIGEFDIRIEDMAFNDIDFYDGLLAGADVTRSILLCEGFYYLILNESGGDELANYINFLTLNFDEEDCECNNVIAEACPITPNDTINTRLYGRNLIYDITYDRDYYVFTPDCSGILDFAVYNTASGVDANVKILKDDIAYTEEKALYASGVGSFDSDTVHLVGGQTYFVELYDTGDGEESPNSIQILLSYTTFVTDSIIIEGDLTFCEDEGSVTLTAAEIGASYLWNTGSTSPSISVEDGGWYSVTVTVDACSVISDSVFVVELPKPILILSDSLIEVCENELPVILSVEGAATYEWSTGETSSSILIDTEGIYFVEGTGINTCQTTSNDIPVIVNELPLVILSPNVSDTTICEGNVIELSVVDGPGYSYEWSDGSELNTLITGESGVYFVNVTNAEGCNINSNEIEVSVAPLPAVPEVLLIGTDLMCSVTGTSYQWYGGGAPIAGETAQYYTPLGDGNYSVEVFNVFGCSAISDEFDFQVGIAQEGTTNTFVSINPNPAVDFVSLEISVLGESNYNLLISDLTGKKQLSQEIQNGINFIDLGVLPAGYYFLSIANGYFVYSGKLSIVK